MNDLKQNTLLREIPDNLLNDKKVVNLAKAVQAPLNKRATLLDKINYTTNLWDVEDAVLDYLLWEKRLDWLVDLTLATTKEQKIQLIESANDIHRHKGTPYAVELLINILFGDGHVEEWFQYGGEPYRFRILTSNPTATNEKALQFIEAIDYVKNTRSHLESVILIHFEQMDLYWGGFVHVGSNEEYRQVE